MSLLLSRRRRESEQKDPEWMKKRVLLQAENLKRKEDLALEEAQRLESRRLKMLESIKNRPAPQKAVPPPKKQEKKAQKVEPKAEKVKDGNIDQRPAKDS